MPKVLVFNGRRIERYKEKVDFWLEFLNVFRVVVPRERVTCDSVLLIDYKILFISEIQFLKKKMELSPNVLYVRTIRGNLQ